MSQMHSRGRRYTVYDNVLDTGQLQTARDAVTASAMAPILSPINRFHDGLAFKARGPRGRLDANLSNLDENDVVQHLASACIRTLLADEQHGDIHAWAYSTSYMAYTVGTQLSWHDDGDDCVGAFNYYLDPWSGHWGGELDMIDCDPGEVPTSGTLVESVVDAPINVTSVFPRMNRMVVIKSGTLHRVRRIDPLAGSHVRRAISGFVAAAERTNGRTADHVSSTVAK